MNERNFACVLTDADMTRGFAPSQPEAVSAGQNWMRAETGSVLPVKRVHDGIVDLGGDFYTVMVYEPDLRRDWFCIDAPDNVVPLLAAACPPPESSQG